MARMHSAPISARAVTIGLAETTPSRLGPRIRPSRNLADGPREANHGREDGAKFSPGQDQGKGQQATVHRPRLAQVGRLDQRANRKAPDRGGCSRVAVQKPWSRFAEVWLFWIPLQVSRETSPAAIRRP